jgi:hypothetical protein
LIAAGVAIAGVNHDFDNDLRDTVPDIGADEIVMGHSGAVPPGVYRDGFLNGGSTLTGNTTFTGNLTLNGVVTTGVNTLTLGCGATVIGAGGINFIIGNVKKDFCGTGSFIFPVGTPFNGAQRTGSTEGGAPEYSPMTATITAGTFPSSLTVTVTDTWMPGTSTLSSLSRHWDVTETGDLTANMTFQYLNEDVYGNEAGYLVFKFEGVTISAQPGTVNAGLNQFTATGVTQFSKWGAGLAPTAAGAALGGRVLDAFGRPIGNALVVLSGGGLAQPRVVQTGPFGYFNFTDLTVGQFYVITVRSGRHTFANPSRVVELTADVTNSDFVADAP